jgi:hypothetical protein
VTYRGEVLPDGEDLGVCFWGGVDEVSPWREIFEE